MSEIHIIAILYPKPEKVERFKELMQSMCKTVHEKEEYTLRYLMTEKLGAPEPEFIMVETYENKAGADKHVTESHFKETFAKFDAEGILAKPAYIAQTKSAAGFDNNRSLL